MLFHRCFKNGDPSFIESLKSRSSNIFQLRTFSQLAPPNHIFTVFVKKYAKYLEEKVSVLRLLSFQFENQTTVCKGIKPPKAFKVVPKLQSQLNALLNCKMRSQQANINNLISKAYMLLLADSVILYSMLSEGVSSLLELFWKMNKKEAQRTLDIYVLYTKETDALIGLFDVGKRFVNKLPAIKRSDLSVIRSMEAYVKGAGPNQRNDSDSDSYEQEQQNQSHLVTQVQNYDEGDYQGGGQDSGEKYSNSSDDGDEPDPFEAFFLGTNAPFQNFAFAQPVIPASFHQPTLVGNNPFQTNTAANPFSTQAANPFTTSVTTTQTTTVMSTNNPFMTLQQQQQQQAPQSQVYVPTPQPGYYQGASSSAGVAQQPQATLGAGNPFATVGGTPAPNNPFTTRNPFQ